jgi:hypothetical protein
MRIHYQNTVQVHHEARHEIDGIDREFCYVAMMQLVAAMRQTHCCNALDPC